jgi:DNA-binding winged helix-turn-helix (wHTH) protein
MSPNPTVSIDPDSGRLQVDRQALLLPFKAQQVLSHIARAAPVSVSRTELIDAIWDGNYLTGDKGLRQAIWSIRSALQDSATSPRFIRTIPRLGYQWIYSASSPRPQSTRLPVGSPYSKRIVGALVLLGITTAITALSWTPSGQADAAPPPEVLKAELRNNSIVVDYTTGCQRIFVPDSRQLLVGDPVVSANRKQVVFRVKQDNACKLVLFELEGDRISKFNSCPDVTS